MKLNIMTWNIDWFRNRKRSGEAREYFEEDSCSYVYDNIILEIIKEYLERENAIVFLQEVPYKAKGERWHNHFLYKKFREDFPSNEYDVFVNEIFAYRCTCAIAKKDIFEKMESYAPCNNRIIAVKFQELCLMGVHMPTEFQENDDDDKMWKQLINYVRKNNVILAGDFNTYIGCKEKLTEKRYLELLNYAGNCVSESIITFGTTSIDKIMLKKTKTIDVVEYTVQIQNESALSDHKYIYMDLLINE